MAQAHGSEIPILTTTYATSTLAGWIAGGHVGLGSSSHGAVWDGIVRRVTLMTVEGAFAPDFDDEIVTGSCVTHAGAIHHEPTRAALEGAED